MKHGTSLVSEHYKKENSRDCGKKNEVNGENKRPQLGRTLSVLAVRQQ